MQYNFDLWAPRMGTQSSKWQHLHEENPIGEETNIALGVAEMDFVCSHEIVEAIQQRAAQGLMGYTISRDEAYLASICSWQHRRFGLHVLPEHIVYCRGANPALEAAVRAFSKPSEGVIIQPPVFQNFARAIRLAGRTLAENHLVQNDTGTYSMNFEELESLAARPENTLMLLCNPNNPTGDLWSEEDLRRLGEICLKNGVKIVSDDVHQEIIRQGLPFNALALLFPHSEEIITVTSLSKGFNLAGLQACHIIVPSASDRDALSNELGRQGPTPLEIAATIAAYTQSDDWLEQVNCYIDGNIQFFDDFMSKELPQIHYASPQATYMVWLDMKFLHLEPEALMNFLREKARLNLNNGASYGEAGNGFVRFNLATPRFVLEEALIRLKKAISAQNM